MKWTGSGMARKNNFVFQIKFGSWLDGEEQANKWFLLCERRNSDNMPCQAIRTERSLRFATQQEAMDFCEKIASGEVSFAQLQSAEEQAWAEYGARRKAEAEQKVDVFMAKMEELGVNPVHIPAILAAYSEMNNTLDCKATTIFQERIDAMKEEQAKAPAEPPHDITLAEYLKLNQNDIDICVTDKDTGEHYMPALCYLTEDDLAAGDCYEPYEQWLLSLPLSHITNIQGCPMAVLRTDFTCDETIFLLGEYATQWDGFDSTVWADYSIRASWADADFSARLAFLTNRTPFEIPFDATCMDAADPADRSELCKLLAQHSSVFIAPSIHNETEFFAYEVSTTRAGRVKSETEIDIKHTEPGKGLASTLDGKIAWSHHLANRATAGAQEQGKASPNKEHEEVR